MEPKQQAPYPLRMPAAMRAELEETARNHGRSLHSELLRRLHESLEPKWGSDQLELEREADEERFERELLESRVLARQAEMTTLARDVERLLPYMSADLPASVAGDLKNVRRHIGTIIATYPVDVDSANTVLRRMREAAEDLAKSIKAADDALLRQPEDVDRVQAAKLKRIKPKPRL